MLNNYFKLNTPFKELDQDEFIDQLYISKHICNIIYKADRLSDQKISNKKFENISISKTTIDKTTFTDCSFKDCLFIGTVFNSVDFHDCIFEDCNFFKSSFKDIYAKPHQFRKAITDDKYSNIAVHLYHQLRENYYNKSQREFKNEAEYYFGHWNRKNNYIQARRKGKNLCKILPSHVISWLYGYLLGYGYRLRNLIITTFILLFIVIFANYYFSSYLFSKQSHSSIIQTIYFTITTMATLGASGYNPDTEIGYFFVIFNVIFGISILSATISAIFKKVIR